MSTRVLGTFKKQKTHSNINEKKHYSRSYFLKPLAPVDSALQTTFIFPSIHNAFMVVLDGRAAP